MNAGRAGSAMAGVTDGGTGPGRPVRGQDRLAGTGRSPAVSPSGKTSSRAALSARMAACSGRGCWGDNGTGTAPARFAPQKAWRKAGQSGRRRAIRSPGRTPHVIIDAPWETHDDLLETVRLLARLPKPYGLAVSSLVFFPGTRLHDRAVAEGLLRDETAQVYRRPFYVPPHRTYAGFLLYLLSFRNFPAPWIRLLLQPKVVAWFGRVNPVPLYRLAYRLGEALRFVGKGVGAVARGEWRRIATWLRARLRGEPGVRGRLGA